MQNIQNIPVEKLIPYKNNPRKNDSAVDAVAESIREFGFRVPIVIDGNNTVICGHTRLKAALRLGMATVPCVMADDLTPEQVKAFRLADNKTNELASWDKKLLDFELDSITDIDMTAFGFPEKEDEVKEEKPEIEFTEELLEEHNYLVLFCDNSVDWLQVESFFDIKPVKCLNSKPGFERRGVGRVINATEFFKKLLSKGE